MMAVVRSAVSYNAAHACRQQVLFVACREVLVCLLPFAACFFLGTGIGVGVGHDENPWVDVVLFGLIAGQHQHTVALASLTKFE